MDVAFLLVRIAKLVKSMFLKITFPLSNKGMCDLCSPLYADAVEMTFSVGSRLKFQIYTTDLSICFQPVILFSSYV